MKRRSSRRVSSKHTMKAANDGSMPRLRLLGTLLFALLLVFVFFVASRHFRNQDAKNATRRCEVYSINVVKEYDHDPHAFTQGLIYLGNGTLYESTGLYGSSSVRIVNLQSGEVLQFRRMERQYFGEGLTLFDHRLFQVAWRITSGFIYDVKNLSMLGTFRHPMSDGWGLATDGNVIYGSDGTSTIYVMQPFSFKDQISTLKEKRRFLVKDQNWEVSRLNELEYIDGELWANVWLTDCIVRIAPSNGQVLGWVLLHELRNNLIGQNYTNIDVLNGIAWDSDQHRLFVTGKHWPKLYEISVQPHSKKYQDCSTVRRMCQPSN